MRRSGELLDRQRSQVLLIDAQERLLAVVPDAAGIVAAASLLLRSAALFKIPVLCTEQYPQGLGSTVPELLPFVPSRVSKTEFSAVSSLGLPSASSPAIAGRDQLILAGVEAHVCVLQTAYDALSAGYRVVIASDACGSRRESDRHQSFQRLRDAGVVVTTVESIVFEWCESASDPEFKTLSRLVKERDAAMALEPTSVAPPLE